MNNLLVIDFDYFFPNPITWYTEPVTPRPFDTNQAVPVDKNVGRQWQLAP